MNVKCIVPNSFCSGVAKAIEMAKIAIEENRGDNVYLIGNLVHNEIVMNELANIGLTIISEKENDLRSSLNSLPIGSIIVFSAHGHPHSYDEIAKRRKFKIYDASCDFVLDNLDLIKKSISNGKNVVYIGKKGHIECESALSLSDEKVKLFDYSNNIYPDLNEKIDNVVICQTTMSKKEIDIAKSELMKMNIDFEFIDQRCLSTKMRQDAIKGIDSNVELIVVLGSKYSNNTLELYDLAKRLHGDNKKIIMALNKDELFMHDLSNYKNAALASGASTDKKTFDEVYEYLINL